jgi:hypothetical protein
MSKKKKSRVRKTSAGMSKKMNKRSRYWTGKSQVKCHEAWHSMDRRELESGTCRLSEQAKESERSK